MTRLAGRALPALLLLAAAAACGGGEPTTPKVRTATSIAMVSGDNQQGIAGAILPQPISVRVSDARGPIPNLTVTFTVFEGGGGTQGGTRTTGEDGIATAAWQVGTQAAQVNRIRATVAGLDQSVTFSATATAGPAGVVSPVGGVGQFAVVNTAVAQPPRVLVGDTFGNPVPGVSVEFTVAAGGGGISGASAVSDAAGIAQVGSWTVGPAPGLNTLRATLSTGGFADIVATGTAAALQLVSGDGQAANAGTLLPAPPSVRALDGALAPLPGVTVTFAVIDGGGSVTGAIGVTNAEGVATPGGWILGPVLGTNRLTATAAGVPPLTFTATGLQGIPASIVDETPGSLTAFLGNFLTGRPTVRVRDAQGAPIAGAPVVFDVVAGGGQVVGGITVTDATGRAQATAWRFGMGGAGQTLRASTPALPELLLLGTATTPPPQGDYNIELRYVGTEPSPSVAAAFNAAVERWQRVIVGDLPTVLGPIPASGTLCDAVNEDVDDVVIFVKLEAIDGPGGILGSAGPCRIRLTSGLTVTGGMRFDVADLASVESMGQLNSLILHEMGHVLGIGTLWSTFGLLLNPATSLVPGDPTFVGAASLSMFPTIFSLGAHYPGAPIPVENMGGPGSFNGHWRKTVLGSELMTRSINLSGPPPALSALSLVSLRDLGYLVNDAEADFFQILPSLMGAPSSGSGPVLMLPPVSTQPIQRHPSGQ